MTNRWARRPEPTGLYALTLTGPSRYREGWNACPGHAVTIPRAKCFGTARRRQSVPRPALRGRRYADAPAAASFQIAFAMSDDPVGRSIIDGDHGHDRREGMAASWGLEAPPRQRAVYLEGCGVRPSIFGQSLRRQRDRASGL
jgi:hypothetical protein